MNIKFNKVIIHNFLSIGDAEIDLANRGYILVEGQNRNPSDGALSNGSGKSSIWNSICWVLTGETLQGLKSNIPNIYGQDGCFVKLLFDVDEDQYEITRYREYSNIKNDLKIIINGEDKSGKGLRESEDLLSQYLPDLTPDLIGNVILLGQGLPHKFSNNTPAGRKELLEKLSKSDFMIADIKNRITIRSNQLNESLREQEDTLLKTQTEHNLYTKQLEETINQLNNLIEPNKEELEQLKQQKNNEEITLANYQKTIEEVTKTIESDQAEYNNINDTYTLKLNNLRNDHDINLREPNKELINLKVSRETLSAEIKRLQAITDICPTCGQKIPGAQKPSTDQQEKQLENIEKDIKQLEDFINNNTNIFNTEYNNLCNEKLAKQHDLTEALNTNRHSIKVNEAMCKTCQANINLLIANIAEKETSLANYETNKNNLQTTITMLTNKIVDIKSTIDNTNIKINNINEHINTVNKINSLIKRDFRGALLTNVIDFINKKAKDYCQYVFNTNDLEIYLDGNNLNISFCKKMYENLSGGEKQKCDLVIQFAIRDMMCQYLGFNSSIMIIDEVFDNLDSIGCSGVINLINNVLTDINSLFIISHHSDSLDIPYDDRLTVIKDETGVSRVI